MERPIVHDGPRFMRRPETRRLHSKCSARPRLYLGERTRGRRRGGRTKPKRPKRTLSAAARRKISLAQKARWARTRRAEASAPVRQSMYYIGLDVHKKTISYCVKEGSGRIHAEEPPWWSLNQLLAEFSSCTPSAPPDLCIQTNRPSDRHQVSPRRLANKERTRDATSCRIRPEENGYSAYSK
jgi:hypothetical protein